MTQNWGTAFRRGERWAWLAFCHWPVMLLAHFATYQGSFRYAQLVWTALTVAALVATYREVWGSRRSESPSEAVATA